ncbi:Dynamin-1-like protein [Perkinsus olseni]|uniref:Dynamin-1-like protein n=1 Tax=Perkinsus olseni TaxID=32597 RepID=A0A7J6QD15_PEROL|nr:Dynamin-1-like protein [Perkinsus olseni]
MAYSSESPRYALDPTATGFHFSKGDPPMSAMDPPPSLSECGSTAPDGSQPPTVADPPPLEGGATASRSGIFGFWRGNSASNAASAIRRDDHSRHSDSEAAVPSPMSPRVNGGAGSAISISGLAPTNPPQGSGGLLWSLGPLRSAAAAVTPMMGARLERDNSITSLSGVIPSGIRLAAPPPVVSVHSSQLSEKERIETDIIKSLIASYLNIVKRSISDLVPKAVMCFMVNTFGADMVLHRELVTQLYKEDLFSELLNEAPEIAQGRAHCAEAIRILRQAAEVISQITNFNMSSPSSAVVTSPRDHPGDPVSSGSVLNMVWLLLPLEGSSSDRSVYYLPQGPTTVGRAYSDILVTKDNTVSRRQCEFVVDAESPQSPPTLRLRDLSRYNTTYRNGNDITEPDRSVVLSSGDVIKIGSASEGFEVLELSFLAYCCRPSDAGVCKEAGLQVVNELNKATHLLVPGEADPRDSAVLSAVVLGKPILSSTVAEFLTNGGKCLNLTTVVAEMAASIGTGKVGGCFLRWLSTSYRPVVSTASCSPECGELLDRGLTVPSRYLSAAHEGTNRRQLFAGLNFLLQSDESRRHLELPLRRTSAWLTASPDAAAKTTVFVGGAKPSPSQVAQLQHRKAYYATIDQVAMAILNAEEAGQLGLLATADVIEAEQEPGRVDSGQLRSRVSLRPRGRPVDDNSYAHADEGSPGAGSEPVEGTQTPTPPPRQRSSRRSPYTDLINKSLSALSGSGGWHPKRPRKSDEPTAGAPEEGSRPIPVVECAQNVPTATHRESTAVPASGFNFKAFHHRRGCRTTGGVPVRKEPVRLVTFTPDLVDGYGDADDDMRLFDEKAATQKCSICTVSNRRTTNVE